MSNKRDLKKTIRGICTDLFTECACATLYGAPEKIENGEALLTAIVAMYNNYICMVGHPEPGMRKKDYYKNLIKNFNKETTEFIDQISAID